MKHSKRFREAKGKVDPKKKYSLNEAIEIVKKLANAKFDESIDLAIKLNIDTKKQDQQVRGTSNLPHGTGKEKKVLVLTKGEKEKEAKEAGADYVGLEEYIEKIKSGWLDFDCVIATPDAMPEVGKLGKILGPKGLMPSPKTGTVTFEVGNQVRAFKKGKVEFKSDKGGCVHVPVGKVSFENEKLLENIKTFIDDLISARPATVKGQFIKTITLSSTMGPGICIDEKELSRRA
uniref:Large ribosomal subunit protein uL1 n=1 Tax=candidate division WOR-3 bacterium TaxID=2052148 RepID=A0A7C4XEJ7_UNCW3